jgi:hypothetical protein
MPIRTAQRHSQPLFFLARAHKVSSILMKAGDRRAAYSLSSRSAANIKDNSAWIRLGFVMRLEIPCIVRNNDDILYVPNIPSVSSKREQPGRGRLRVAPMCSGAQRCAAVRKQWQLPDVWRKLPDV